MRTKFSTLSTSQAGEYLVAAELCRRGLAATTFSGNMPGFDIVALKPSGEAVLVQVKAIREGVSSWLLNTNEFLAIELTEGHHRIAGLRPAPAVLRVWVFVVVGTTNSDRFFVLRFHEVQEIVRRRYSDWLDVKPRPTPNPSDIPVSLLREFQDHWSSVTGDLSTEVAAWADTHSKPSHVIRDSCVEVR